MRVVSRNETTLKESQAFTTLPAGRSSSSEKGRRERGEEIAQAQTLIAEGSGKEGSMDRASNFPTDSN